MPKKISEKNVLAALETLNGRKRNPFDEDSFGCVYTHEKDPERHCIAGQILIDLGWGHKLPALDNYLNGSSIDALLCEAFTPAQFEQIEPAAAAILSDLQALADDGTPTWASARKEFYAKREREQNRG